MAAHLHGLEATWLQSASISTLTTPQSLSLLSVPYKDTCYRIRAHMDNPRCSPQSKTLNYICKDLFFFSSNKVTSLVLELRTWPSVYGQGDHHSAHYPFLIPPPTLSFQSHWPRSCASTCLTHFHPRAFAHAVPSAWVSLTLYRRMQICLILSWGLHNFSS